jgi:membrane-bound lytic murein transglycosylase
MSDVAGRFRAFVMAAAVSIAAAHASGANGAPTLTLLSFDDLDGWSEDDHDKALSTFLETCGTLDGPDWTPVCALAQTNTIGARGFFEALFLPVLIQDGKDALFTGYFEPEIRGSRTRGGAYRFPIFAAPPDLPPRTAINIGPLAVNWRGVAIYPRIASLRRLSGLGCVRTARLASGCFITTRLLCSSG